MYDATMVAIDVEATGLSDIDDEVIEVAAVRFRGLTEVDHYTTLVKPSVAIPFKISRITNITDEMVADKPTFAEVRAQLKAFIGDDPVLGHSVDFDVRMLAGSGLRLKQPAIDTFELATLVTPNAGSFKLTDLVKKLGVTVQDDGDAHRALYDARLAQRLFCRLYELLIDNDMALIEEVLRITRTLPNWPLRPIFAQALSDVAKASFGKNKPRRVRSLDDYIPLEPTNSSTPIRNTTIEKIFSTKGVLGRMFPGYEQREPQVTMSTAVAEAFNTGDHLIVEAGTGTGKGLAYLVPSALHALERGQRVVLTTHTINLQDQLFFKDIPALTKIFDAERAAGNTQIPDIDLQSALLKGRSNYLCMRRLDEAKVIGGTTDDDTKSLLKVAMWATKTDAGDRNEIALFDREMVTWNRLHAGFDMCNGPACAYFDQCWFFLARRQAEAAHLVVVNHALLLIDMVMESPILPPYDHVVIDEAHNLEDVATDQFGWRLDYSDVITFFDSMIHEGGQMQAEGLLLRLPTFLKGSTAGRDVSEQMARIVERTNPYIERARAQIRELFDLMSIVMLQEAETNSYDTRLRITAATRRLSKWQPILPAWENVALSFRSIALQLNDLTQLVDALADANIVDYEALASQTKSLNRFVMDFNANMAGFIHGEDANLITWMLQARNRDELQLAIAPLEVASLLRERLFDKKKSVILTSATLSVNNRFDYVQKRLGVDTDRQIQLDSPYDYEDQVLLYLPQDMPEPKDFEYQQILEQAIVDTAIAASGRTLVLFTSTSALRATYNAVYEKLAEQGINLLGQNMDGSRKLILERFKTEPRSVLFGTSSFWEGVDVVGDALSALIITKLPFAVPSDPIYAARAEQFTDAFNEYSLPQSILKFKQGFGRLVRAKDDRGIVIALDRRLTSKKYGQQFLQSLPATTVRTGPIRAVASLVRRTVTPPLDQPE